MERTSPHPNPHPNPSPHPHPRPSPSPNRFNLLYGRRDATAAQLEAACTLARVDGYVDSLEAGLETMVGERGLRLSGGEKQRL